MKKLIAGFVVWMAFQATWAGSLDREIDSIFDQYFKIHKSLSKDSTAGINEAAAAIVQAASALKPGDAELQKLVSDIKAGAGKIQGASLDSARDAFFDLSKPLLIYVNKYYSGEKEYSRFYCSMANKAWIEPDRDLENPYHGSSMLKCGELIE